MKKTWVIKEAEVRFKTTKYSENRENYNPFLFVPSINIACLKLRNWTYSYHFWPEYETNHLLWQHMQISNSLSNLRKGSFVGNMKGGHVGVTSYLDTTRSTGVVLVLHIWEYS